VNGYLVCAQPEAAEAGAAMLARGGNAIDAAVAAALVQCVVDPLNASIGGFGVAQVRLAGEAASTVVGFHARAPRRAAPDMFRLVAETSAEPLASGTWQVEGDANQIGHLAVGVPGTVAGLAELSDRFGALPWSEALGPAIAACDGWVVTGEHWADWTRPVPATRLDALERLRYSPDGARVYTDGGALRRPGATIVNEDYGRTLRALAREGARAFYAGDVAAAIAADFERAGGLLRADDLEGYRVDLGPPLELEYRGLRVTAPGPPAGGALVLEILRRLERHDLSALAHNGPEHVRAVSAAMRGAFAAMRDHLGDPEFVADPVGRILGGEAAVAVGAPEETTHVSAVDELGNCAAVTHTLGAASGVVTPGLGFLFNGAMHRFDPVPGRANSIAPGKRRVSGIAPTIVWDGARPLLVVGAAGGHSIVSAVAQAVSNVVDFGMDALAAVSAPRLHCEAARITLEGRFARATLDALAAAGEDVAMVPHRYERMVAGSAQAIVTPAGERPGAGADPRQAGIATGGLTPSGGGKWR
jgi:gamma-glutamyltranspeptidase/glutathione hydrolase